MSNQEIEDLDQKVQEILDILRGKGERSGLVAKVNEHAQWIDDQKKRTTLLRFDLFRAFLTGMVTILMAIVIWIAGKVSTAFQYEGINGRAVHEMINQKSQ